MLTEKKVREAVDVEFRRYIGLYGGNLKEHEKCFIGNITAAVLACEEKPSQPTVRRLTKWYDEAHRCNHDQWIAFIIGDLHVAGVEVRDG